MGYRGQSSSAEPDFIAPVYTHVASSQVGTTTPRQKIVTRGVPIGRFLRGDYYCPTDSRMLSLWLLNSGAYIH